ncbi:hypothetical protein D3C86_1135090 [compost metagenome]
MHIPTHQTDFQWHSGFAQGLPQQFVVAMGLLRATGQHRRQARVRQAVEDAGHVVQFGLHLWATSQACQLCLPDLPDLKFLAQQ